MPVGGVLVVCGNYSYRIILVQKYAFRLLYNLHTFF